MTKHFCDCCGKELTHENSVEDRLRTTLSPSDKLYLHQRGGIKVEVIVGKEAGWNNADFCKYCILDALYDLDDRPKAK